MYAGNCIRINRKVILSIFLNVRLNVVFDLPYIHDYINVASNKVCFEGPINNVPVK
jgi:hypothetical protein